MGHGLAGLRRSNLTNAVRTSQTCIKLGEISGTWYCIQFNLIYHSPLFLKVGFRLRLK